MKRPTSVSVASLYILFESLGIAVILFVYKDVPITEEMMAHSEIPVPLRNTISFVAVAIGAACSIGIWEGYNWGRVLYCAWGALSGGVSLVTVADRVVLVPGLLIFLVVALILYRPRANAFFEAIAAASTSRRNAQNGGLT